MFYFPPQHDGEEAGEGDYCWAKDDGDEFHFFHE